LHGAPLCAVKFYHEQRRDCALSLRTDRKSASGGVNLKFKHAASWAALARERHKSAGAKFKRGGAAFKFAFAARWRRAARLKFNDLKSAQVGA